MALIETELLDITKADEAMEPGSELDHCVLEQHAKQTSSLKRELPDVSYNIITLDEDNTGLADRRSSILKAIFSMPLQIQRLFQMPKQAPHQEVIKLPKINIPTFKEDIMEWCTFWEQLDNLVHCKLQLSDPIKLAYR